MSKTVRLTFAAAALLIILSMTTCDYAHRSSWNDASSTEASPEYTLSCGSYDPEGDVWVSAGIVLGFFAAPVFFAGWLFWYREIQLELNRTPILRLEAHRAGGQFVDAAPKEQTVRDESFNRADRSSIPPFDANGLTPLERVLAG